MSPDELDAALITAMSEDPRISMLALSRRCGVSRATVQLRLDKLQRSGAVRFAPSPDPLHFGYPVTAFVSVELVQTDLDSPLPSRLAEIPEVLDIYRVTGAADLLVRIVGTSNEDLQRVIYRILGLAGVTRTSTAIVLSTLLANRTEAVFGAAADRSPEKRSSIQS